MSDSEEDAGSKEKRLKIVVVGESNVGKTSIIRRWCHDDFTRHYNPTMGIDFYIKHINGTEVNDITVCISDIGGQELNGKMLDKYVFNSNLVLFVYDITNAASFECLPIWMKATDRTIEKEVHILRALIGNKCDLEHQRAVRLDRTQQFIKYFNVQNFTVSAKTGEMVNTSFLHLLSKYLNINLTEVKASPEKLINFIHEQVPNQSRVLSGTKSNNSFVCSIQ